jgi:hypothetical protein
MENNWPLRHIINVTARDILRSVEGPYDPVTLALRRKLKNPGIRVDRLRVELAPGGPTGLLPQSARNAIRLWLDGCADEIAPFKFQVVI